MNFSKNLSYKSSYKTYTSVCKQHVSTCNSYVLPMCWLEESAHETEAIDFNTTTYTSTYKIHVPTYSSEYVSITVKMFPWLRERVRSSIDFESDERW